MAAWFFDLSKSRVEAKGSGGFSFAIANDLYVPVLNGQRIVDTERWLSGLENVMGTILPTIISGKDIKYNSPMVAVKFLMGLLSLQYRSEYDLSKIRESVEKDGDVQDFLGLHSGRTSVQVIIENIVNCVDENLRSIFPTKMRISDEERDARNAFYRTIVWVVNGSRLKRDRDRFFKTIENGIKICDNPQVIKIFLSESSLVEKWAKSKAPVFFDFGDESLLWCLYPTNSNQWGFVSPIKKVDFISFHQGEENQLKGFLEFLQVFKNVILSYFFQIQRQQQLDLQRQILMRPQSKFQRYLARQRGRRRL